VENLLVSSVAYQFFFNLADITGAAQTRRSTYAAFAFGHVRIAKLFRCKRMRSSVPVVVLRS